MSGPLHRAASASLGGSQAHPREVRRRRFVAFKWEEAATRRGLGSGPKQLPCRRSSPQPNLARGDPRRGGRLSPLLVSVTELKPSDVAFVDQFLPLSRLSEQIDEGSTYLVAWDDRQPVGHAHIAWTGTHLGVPEIQDVFVLPEWRRRGIASQLTLAAEDEARARGWASISLSASQEGNDAARHLYAKLGYVDAPVDPVRVSGVITIRGQPLEVDDTLVYLMKPL